jgi:aminopeptidase 2
MCRHADEGSDPTATNIKQPRQILPADVKPLHYHVTLEPNLKTFEYDGEVVIE